MYEDIRISVEVAGKNAVAEVCLKRTLRGSS